MAILSCILYAACGDAKLTSPSSSDREVEDSRKRRSGKDGPAAAFRRLLAAEKGRDRRVWMECFTAGTREWFVETLLMTHEKGTRKWGLTSKDLKLPTMELLEKVQPAPDNWTFEHEVTEGEEKILNDTTGWVERKTAAGRPRRYWCRLEQGRWRFDYPLTLDSER